MKKFLLSVLCVSVCFNASAQLTVDANGNVGIATDSTTYKSNLVVGEDNAGMVYATADILCGDNERALNLNVYRSLTNSFVYGVYSRAHDPGHKSIGVLGFSRESSPTTGRKFGVMGIAGDGNGGSFGVCGHLDGTMKGAGVLGTSSVSDCWGGSPYLASSDRYAGYFMGTVRSTDVVTAVSFVTTSDERLKENVVSIEADKTKSGILDLNAVSYTLKTTIEKDTKDTIEQKLVCETSRALGRKHYGLIAQEVQKIFPELVYEDGDGILSVNYIELIPVMIQALQEMNTEIENLKGKNAEEAAKTASADNSVLDFGKNTVKNSLPAGR